MPVFGHRKRRGFAVNSTRHDDRQLAFQLEAGFQDTRHSTEPIKGLRGFCFVSDDHLALAIVAQTIGLEYCGKGKTLDRVPNVAAVLYASIGCGGKPMAAKKGLLGDSVLGYCNG